MDDAEKIGQFILFIVALIFSSSVHEALHAWTSSYFGDDLARSQGRVSLNPVVHFDFFGSLLFPAVAFFGSGAMLGWARSTPTNPLRWRNKNVANFWVSIAGILGNLAIAAVAGIVLRVMYETGYLGRVSLAEEAGLGLGVINMVRTFFILNVTLAVFNLLPIPPLDGSHILQSLLPDSYAPAFEVYHTYGIVLLFLVFLTGILNPVFDAVLGVAGQIVLIGAR